MANLLFFNVPGHGHVNPSLPLTAELVRRGHNVTCFNSPGYRRAGEATGAAFEPYATVADNFFEPFIDTELHPMRVASALMTKAGELLPELQQRARDLQADAILFDCMCPWGYYLARSLRLPAIASFSLMPLMPPRYLLRDWASLRAMIPIIARDFGHAREAIRRANALGEQYGVRPIPPANLLNAEGDLSISHTSAEFVRYSAVLPQSVVFTGWTLNDDPREAASTFGPEDGKPLVYVSLGTIFNGSPAFFRACIEAFQDADVSVLISTGGRVDPAALGPLPANISARNWVPQIAVLRRTALVVTHGGMGSVHDAFYLGLPMLLVPQQLEQTVTAQRVAEVGAGLLLHKNEVTARVLREYATRLLTDPRFATASARMGDTLRAAGGAPRAADYVEALLER